MSAVLEGILLGVAIAALAIVFMDRIGKD